MANLENSSITDDVRARAMAAVQRNLAGHEHASGADTHSNKHEQVLGSRSHLPSARLRHALKTENAVAPQAKVDPVPQAKAAVVPSEHAPEVHHDHAVAAEAKAAPLPSPTMGGRRGHGALKHEAAVVAEKPTLGHAIQPAISQNMIDFTQRNPMNYELGAKGNSFTKVVEKGHGPFAKTAVLKVPKIDCSGWAAKAVLNTMENINAKSGRAIYDTARMGDTLNTGAAWQFEGIRQQTKIDFPKKDILKGNLPAGSLVAVSMPTTESFANDRPRGISHIGVVVVNDKGERFISESSPKSNGVSLTPYKEWVDNYDSKGATLHATNPFALTKTNDLALADSINGTKKATQYASAEPADTKPASGQKVAVAMSQKSNMGFLNRFMPSA